MSAFAMLARARSKVSHLDIKRAVQGNNSTASGATGRKMQATVTGYQDCLTQGMACGITGSPGKDPTGAMSGYLIPTYASGVCGTCWKLTNPRGLNYPGNGQIPTIGAPLNSPQGNGMVVLVNNACAPDGKQGQPDMIGQCDQTNANPKDKLGSETVLDLCSDTNAVEMLWGSPNPGLAVADLEEVSCSQWSGTIHKAS